MKNYHIGTITGIPIRINITVLVFLPVLAWLISREEQLSLYAGLISSISPHQIDPSLIQTGTTPLLIGSITAVGLFLGVLLHELGHSWAARRYNVAISSITLWIFGGMAHMEDLPEDWNMEFWIALAGPVTSILLGGVFYLFLLAVPDSLTVLAFIIGWFAVINIILAVFNLLPAFPMDGGRVLRALLARSQPYSQATQTAAFVGKSFAVLLAVLGVLGINVILILIAMFIYIAASSESKATVIRELLKGVTVRDIMTTDTTAVSLDDSVTDLMNQMVHERRTGHPVLNETGNLVGIVTLSNIQGIPEPDRASKKISDIMDPSPPTISPDADAFEALMIISSTRANHIPVVHDNQPVGIVSNAELMNAIKVIEGLQTPDTSQLTPDGYS